MNVLDAVVQLRRALARAATTVVCEAEGKAVTLRHAAVLRELRSGGPTQQIVLSRATVMDPSFMARLLDDLEKRGLVSRRRSEVDRRQVTVSLTARGKKALGVVDHLFEHLATTTESALTRDERLTFVALAEKVTRALAASTAAESDE